MGRLRNHENVHRGSKMILNIAAVHNVNKCWPIFYHSTLC